MLEENKSKEKNCLFFISDYHFEMISLPYINENIKEDKNIIVVSENNLEGTMNKLIAQVNLEEKEKENILKIDWKNDELNKFKEIKQANEEKKDTIIFIKGKENYIQNVNKNIENWIGQEKVKIRDCYDINEIKESVDEIAKNYDNILVTSGMKKL